jgi:predicted NBD/HSP70 family sugar kinase
MLEAIWLNRISSRAGMAEFLAVDKSTVTNIINELLEHGLLVVRDDSGSLAASAVEESAPRRGRRRTHLEVRRNFGVMLGFEIQPEAISAVAVDMHGSIVAETRKQMNGRYGSNVAEKLANYLPELLEEWRTFDLRVLGAAIGVSGVVDPEAGYIKWSMPLGITDGFDFLGTVRDRFAFPIRVDNDAKCASWGPLVFDRTEELQNFLTLFIEFEESDANQRWYDRISAGLGLVVNGSILHGPDHTAGEFRSIMVDETSFGQFHMEYHDLIQVKEDKNRRHEFLVEVAQNIGYLVNVLNLQAVYLGGGIDRYQEELLPLIEHQIQLKWLYNHRSKVNCPIRFVPGAGSAAAYGAACMMLRHLFTAQSAPESVNELLEHALNQNGLS